MTSFNVPHMAISADNGLQSLCRGANIPIVKDFYATFPNLRKFDRGCKCHYLRTDGVSACLVMISNEEEEAGGSQGECCKWRARQFLVYHMRTKGSWE